MRVTSASRALRNYEIAHGVIMGKPLGDVNGAIPGSTGRISHDQASP
jgi:hypothetical protein